MLFVTLKPHIKAPPPANRLQDEALHFLRVVFHTFTSRLLTLYCVQKRKIPYSDLSPFGGKPSAELTAEKLQQCVTAVAVAAVAATDVGPLVGLNAHHHFSVADRFEGLDHRLSESNLNLEVGGCSILSLPLVDARCGAGVSGSEG